VAEKVSDLHQVAKRFQSFNRLKQEPIKNVEENDNYEDNDEIIVGKNTNIDKPYLRITGRPDPDTVRPLLVLQKALRHFREEYRQGKVPYDALISQMKSIRQDLTVQHIRSPFTVEVYEENFKISLFENDIIQLKQCQANLW
jgi:SAC3 family protein LENG8/THP3